MRKIKDRGEGRIGFRVRVQPSAPKSKLLGWNKAGELRVSVAAPPREGAANRELVTLLAKQFSLRKREMTIESGERSRVKLVSAPGSIRDALLDLPDL
jgi:uncharacterized protein (TIGR00251 family)